MNRERSKSELSTSEREFQVRIVRVIVQDRNPEKAIQDLCTHYKVERPALRMGLPKGEKQALGCYVQRNKTIFLANTSSLYDPYVIIHEFYHHLRSASGKHRGTEKHAREFALSFLRNARDYHRPRNRDVRSTAN